MRQTPADRFIANARTFTRRLPSEAKRWRETAVRAGRTGLPPVVRALRSTGRAGESWRRELARRWSRVRTSWNTRRQSASRRVRVRPMISRAEIVRRRRVLLLGGGALAGVVIIAALIVVATRVREKVDAAGLAVGDDAGVYQVMGDWLAMQHARLAEYHEALRNFMIAGSIDGATLTSLDEIGFRITLAEKLRQASNNLTEVFTHGVESLPDRMEAWGVSEARAEEEIARLRDRNDWPVALELRHKDEEAMGLFVRYLTLLKQTWGEWTYSEASSEVTFSEKVAPGTVEEFNNMAGNIRRIARDQAELRGKLGG